MFIDEKGKLFGKVSIIDILVVVLIVVGIFGIGFAYKQIKANDILTENKSLFGQQTDLDTLVVTMRLEEVREVTVSAIKEGDEIFAADTGKYIGEISQVSTEPATRTGADIYGDVFEAELPERYDVILTVNVPGKLTDGGYMTASNIHLVYGSTMEVKTPAVQTFPQIEKITVAEDK